MRRLVDYDSSSSSSSSSDLTEEDRQEDKEGRRTDGPPSLPPDFADVPALHGSGAVLTPGDHHISLAWSPLPRPVSSLKQEEEEEEEETRLHGRLAARLADITIDVSCVKLKIGSTITSIHLAE